jgi:alkylated DNA repair dioxygenase AlkB
MKQGTLFGIPQALPGNFAYKPDFIDANEEANLLAEITRTPLHDAQYKGYVAKRRVVSYENKRVVSHYEPMSLGSIPPFLNGLRDRISSWIDVPNSQLVHAVIAEYRTGAQVGWHRDSPEFEIVVGVSLGGQCAMRFRHYPLNKRKSSRPLTLELAARSAYVLRGESRWAWQHSIPHTQMLRYSITFRSRREIATKKDTGTRRTYEE